MRGHSGKRLIHSAVIAILLVVMGNLMVPVVTTYAAGATFSVNTATDEIDAGSCSSITASSGAGADGKLSLREAVCEADNTASTAGSPNVINVPAGTYQLSLSAAQGDLVVGSSTALGMKIVGAGAATTTIQQVDGIDRVMETPFGYAVNATFQGLTITGGHGDGFGGGGLLVGSVNAVTTIVNCTISGNTTIANGGGIESGDHGALSITGSVISGNTSGTGGGGVAFQGEKFTMDTSTVSGNHAGGYTESPGVVDSGSGGGLNISDTDSTSSIKHSTITNNNTVAGTSGNPDGGGLEALGSITVQYTRLVNNTVATGGVGVDANEGLTTGTLTATDDWWGINTNPTTSTPALATHSAGNLTVSPWLVLTTTASPATVNYGKSTTLTASFVKDSNSNTILVSDLSALIGLPVTWANATHGTLSNQQGTIQSSATATATLTTDGTCNNASAEAKVDNIPNGDTAATGTVTVQCPDLGATKTNDVSGSTTLGNTWNWTITATNSGPGYATYTTGQTILQDNLPNANITYGSVTVTPVSGVTGTVNCSIDGSDNLTCTAGSAVQLDASSSFTVVFSASPSTSGTYANPRASGTCSMDPNNNVPETNESNNTCSDSVTVTAPDLTLAKSNNVSNAVSAGQGWNWTLTAANTGNGAATFTDGQTILQDDLPQTGVTYGTPVVGGVTNVTNSAKISCSIDANQTLTCIASGASVVIGATTGTFNVVVPVTSLVSGTYTNPRPAGICRVDPGSSVSESNESNNDCAANTVTANPLPPVIIKSFGAASIPLNGTTTLTFMLTNPSVNSVSANGVAFTDTLPSGLVVAATPGVSNTCGGTVTATSNSGSISLSGGTIGTGASNTCSISVSVTGTSAGNLTNITGAISSTNTGTGGTATASIVVVGPASISKGFGAASIPLNGSTSLTFLIQNSNATSLTGVAFSDTLPAGLVVSTPSGLANACGGTPTAAAGTNTISLTGGSIAPNGSCQISVNVTGIAAGIQNNTTGNVTSNEGGTGGTATASIVVEAPPSIAKAFNPSAIAVNGTTSLTFTITNPAANPNSLTGVAFTDTLPTGLTVASASSTVCGGTLTTTSPTGIALSGATIAANTQCQFSVTVTGSASGVYTNTTGAVTSTNGGTGNTASAVLNVATPPAIVKTFGASTVPLGGTTSLKFQITNPTGNLALTGIAFTDTLPAGLVLATPTGLTGNCGGTVTANPGGSTIQLSGGTLQPSTNCVITVTVKGMTAGVQNNQVTVSSTEGGTGNTSTAAITVVAPPTIVKSFGAPWIFLGKSTTVTFTLQNPNSTVALTGVGFSDTLPSGLQIANPVSVSGNCGNGSVITATAGTSVISLSSGTLAAGGQCFVTVTVTGTGTGTQVNVTGNVTSNEGGTGTTATASINVYALPSIVTTAGPDVVAGSGQALTDQAVLTGGYNPTGTITFYLFAPGVTPNGSNSNAVYSDTVTVSGDGTYSTSQGTNPGGYLPVALGTYQWVAVYSGDSNNPGTSEAFGQEPEGAFPALTIYLSVPAPYTAYTQTHIYNNGVPIGVVSVGTPLKAAVTGTVSLTADQVILATSGNNTDIFTGFVPPVSGTLNGSTSTTATYTSIEATLSNSISTGFLGTSTQRQQTYTQLVGQWNNAETAIKQPYASSATKLTAVKTFACTVTTDRNTGKITSTLATQLETYAGDVYRALGGTYTGSTLC